MTGKELCLERLGWLPKPGDWVWVRHLGQCEFVRWGEFAGRAVVRKHLNRPRNLRFSVSAGWLRPDHGPIAEAVTA
jgi:hypothetical protein